jgi:hypothetical protein
MEKLIRNVGFGLGFAATATVVAFAIGEGLPSPSMLTHRELAEFGGLACMIGGVLAALKWRRFGGTLTLAGAFLFQAVEWSANHKLMPALFLIFPLAALLLLMPPSHKTGPA